MFISSKRINFLLNILDDCLDFIHFILVFYGIYYSVVDFMGINFFIYDLHHILLKLEMVSYDTKNEIQLNFLYVFLWIYYYNFA